MPSIVVCVTDQQSCVRLIHAGRQLADQKDCPLHVLSIAPPLEQKRLHGDVLEYLFAASRQAGAEMFVFYNERPIETALEFCDSKSATDLILGVGPDNVDGFAQALFHQSTATIHVIGKNGEHLYPEQQAI